MPARDLWPLFIKLVNSYNQNLGLICQSKIFLQFTEDNCQYWKNLEEMTLSSPNYPKWYNTDGVGCEWLISAPEGFTIALEFNHFHVSDLLDFNQKNDNILQHFFS